MSIIGYNEAASKAMEYAQEILNFNEFAPVPEFKNLSLEEIQLSEDKKSWIITVSWEEKVQEQPNLGLVSSIYGNYMKKYKTFYIDSKEGSFQKMTVWKNDAE